MSEKIKTCEDFPFHSRKRAICEGKSDLPISRVNAYRAGWGLEPLVIEKESGQNILKTQSGITVRSNIPDSVTKKKCCGGSNKPEKDNVVNPDLFNLTGGPGSELINIFSSIGFKSCEECYILAEKMDARGPDECENNIEEIINDIMPRAENWKKQNLGWFSRAFPDYLVEDFINMCVLRAIKKSRKQNDGNI